MDDPTRVLYIGDSEPQRVALAADLEDRGCRVAVAPGGAEALALIAAAADDGAEVVICDYKLQGETGLDVLAELQRLDPELPVIIVTSHGSIPLGVKAIKQGAFQFITKPYDLDELEVVVTQAREHRQMRRQLRRSEAAVEGMNAELAASTEVLQAIVDASPTAILMVGVDGRIKASNRATSEMFGVDGAAINGGTLEAFFERIAPCFADEQAFRQLAIQLAREPDGGEVSEPDHAMIFERMLEAIRPRRRFLSFFCAPVGDPHGRELGRVWVCSDVSRLKEADEQLHMIVDLSPVPLIITRLDDGQILFANEPLGALVGVPSNELVGRQSPDFYCRAEDRADVIARVERDGQLRDHEVCFRRANGEQFWALLSLAPAEIDGRPALIGAVNDIDQRKRAEDALRWERNFVSAILDTASALVVVLDAKGGVVRFNRASQQTSGYTLDEVRGKAFWDVFLLAEERERAKDLFTRIGAGDYPVRHEGCWQTKRGEARLIEWSNTALTDADGEVEYVIATGIDVTERRLAEQGLELYRQIFNNASDGITVLDPEARILERNPAHQRLSGLDDERVLGRSIGDYFDPGVQEGIGKVLAEEGRFRGEVTFNRDDDDPLDLDLSVFPILDEGGEVQRLIGMGRDITERKRMVRDLEQANHELKQTQTQLVQSEKMAALGMLVAGIAHEINTPVGAINSTHSTLVQSVIKLKQLLEAAIPDELQSDRKLQRVMRVMDESNQVIESASGRVTKIVRRLRSFARLDEAELKQVDLHEGLEDTLTILHHELKHSVEVERSYGELPRVPCYPGPMNQVFLNLLMNAKQAIGDRGTITITTRVEGERVLVAIGDDGHGMSPETVARIFDPGFTTKGVGVGTGLGLSICYRIMQDHHGEIRVESEVGKGSTFTVVLPVNLDKILNKDL